MIDCSYLHKENMEGSKASAQDSLHLLQRNKGNRLPEWNNFTNLYGCSQGGLHSGF
jgi:hypothetical protein